MGIETFRDDRLQFQLPDFTRISWVNDHACEIWQPRLKQITGAWLEIEWRSIVAGVRRCALTVLSPESFVERAGIYAEAGLNAMPLEIQGLTNFSYASTSTAVQPGQLFGFRVAVGKPEDVAAFKQAFDSADNIKIGQLLGFPDCCQSFFESVWVDQSMVDTTWPMAAGTNGAEPGDRSLSVTGPIEANILWRWMGVRAVPHLPCSFECQATVEFGKALMAVGRDAGFEQEMDWLEEILSWPAEWSALHGIAEVKTPVLKVSTRTDATAHKFTVQRQSDRYPEEAIKGLRFPFQTPPKPILTGSRHHQRGLDEEIPEQAEFLAWYASDNGFSTKMAMDRAHQPILDLAAETLGAEGGSVLDLGCGNGALLKKLHARVPDLAPFGVDVDPGRVAHAAELLPDYTGNFSAGDIFEPDVYWPEERKFDLVLMMPGRLLEVDPEKAGTLLRRLNENCGHILVYAYGDWLERHDGLVGLAKRVGLEMMGNPQTTAGEVAVGLARAGAQEAD